MVRPNSPEWDYAKKIGDEGERLLSVFFTRLGMEVTQSIGNKPFDLKLSRRVNRRNRFAELGIAIERSEGAAWEVTRPFADASFELLLSGSVEGKRDLQYAWTGNVAVEVECRKQPSGIVTTSATWWATLLGNEVVVVRSSVLYDALDFTPYPEKRVGDDGAALVRLVPVDEFRRVPGALCADLREEVTSQTLAEMRLTDILIDVGCDGEAL